MNTDQDLNFTERNLLIFMIRRAAKDGEAYCRQQWISEKIHLSLDQIQRYFKRFHETGRMMVVRMGLRMANSYLFPWHAGFAPERPRSPCTPATHPENGSLTPDESAAFVRFPETASVRLPMRNEKQETAQQRALPESRSIAPKRRRPLARRETSQPVIRCAPEEFERLRDFLFQYVQTDRYWNRLPVAAGPFSRPPDSTIVARIAAAANWDVAAIVTEGRRQKIRGKKPEYAYAWFEFIATDARTRRGRCEEVRNTPETTVSRLTEPLDRSLRWDRIRAVAQPRVTPESYENWFALTRQVEEHAESTTVAVPDQVTLAWLTEEYGELIRQVCKELNEPELILWRVNG